jgi:hypothetical protein
MQVEHVPRWIAASIFKHFEAKLAGMPFLVEGQDRSKVIDKTEFFELAINGPHQHQITMVEWEFYVEISLLITSHRNSSDLYKMQRLLGIALSAMQVCIPVLKYGDGSDDTKEKLGDLIRMESPTQPTDVANYGQVESTSQVDQGTVAADYYVCLKE